MRCQGKKRLEDESNDGTANHTDEGKQQHLSNTGGFTNEDGQETENEEKDATVAATHQTRGPG
jgi:hypothetical protein